nr:SIR2 family protein [uncultured Cohaesibacter sp.]
MVWEAADVAATYADPTVLPDAEHYAIAALVREGLVTELPSANWDGLIEKAMGELTGEPNGLKVCVRAQDLQAPDQKATLIKFHGCAIRASEDEATYRPYLVGAQWQIDGWETNPRTQALAQYLISVAITKPTLMLGFSAQDANIRKVFGLAAATQNWAWPGELPAYVMAEDSIGEAQTALLGNVYPDQFAGDDRAAIKRSAHLRAFAKPLLPALLLWTFAAKLRRLARLGAFDLSDAMATWVDDGIQSFRNRIAATDDGDHLRFVRSLVFGLSRSKRIFLSGKNEIDATRYEPLTPIPLNQMNQDLESETNGLPEGAMIVAALAQGAEAGDWSLKLPQAPDTKNGSVEVTKGTRTDRVFLLGRPEAELALFDSEAILDEDEDVILIHAHHIHERLPRSPSRAPGRTARSPGPRRLSMASLLTVDGTPGELMERFKLEANL